MFIITWSKRLNENISAATQPTYDAYAFLLFQVNREGLLSSRQNIKAVGKLGTSFWSLKMCSKIYPHRSISKEMFY